MLDKRDWAAEHAGAIAHTLLREPRGHRDMCGAVLTEPSLPSAHAGVLFMDGSGFTGLSGTGIVAVATMALERGLLTPGGGGAEVVFDTVAGLVRAHAAFESADARRVSRVRYVNVPSFVLMAGLPVKIGARTFRADVAYGGAFYAIVDAESAGLGVNPSLAPELARAGRGIVAAIEATRTIEHPLEPRLGGLAGTIFTTAPSSEIADLRSVTVFGDGAVERAPGGNSTAALMAVLSAMGLLDDSARFTHESIRGSVFAGEISSRTSVGGYDGIVPSIEASSWITGEHTFIVADEDPDREGFVI